MKEVREPTFTISLLGGGIAGTTVDVALFPIDTIKTRLQSPQGFLKAGGFKGVYKGLSAAAVGSAPGASLFFATYEMGKQQLLQKGGYKLPEPVVHMTAAAMGEMVACMVRVPTEVVKQRMQMGIHSHFIPAITSIVKTEGIRGLYSGFFITIMREIPFSFVQFPLYEAMKSLVGKYSGRPAAPYEAAVCGSLSGAVAAAVTTPLDVLKTRMMLGADVNGVPYRGIVDTLTRVIAEGHNISKNASSVSVSAPSQLSLRSFSVLFSGVGPRVMWISIGGFVFFGAYEQAKSLLFLVL